MPDSVSLLHCKQSQPQKLWVHPNPQHWDLRAGREGWEREREGGEEGEGKMGSLTGRVGGEKEGGKGQRMREEGRTEIQKEGREAARAHSLQSGYVNVDLFSMTKRDFSFL